MGRFRSFTRKILPLAAGALLFGMPAVSRGAENEKLPLKSIDYVVATQNIAISVSASVYAAYAGSCLNADAFTPSVDQAGRNAVYVCDVRPKTVAELESRRIVPDTVGYGVIRR